jgi:hypothetical protein
MKKNITTKFADFKQKKVDKYKKDKVFEPLSDDVVALRELENGDFETISDPINILQITDIITDKERINKLEEAISGSPVFSTDIEKEVKRGDVIYIVAFVTGAKSTAWTAQKKQCVLKCRISDIYTGLNKLNYIK